MLLTLHLGYAWMAIELFCLGVAVSEQRAEHAKVHEIDVDGNLTGPAICSTADMLSCASTEASMD